VRQPGISKTRERVLQFIRDFFDKRGYAPTVRDILKGCDISSTAVVQHHLDVLEREGRIHRDPEVFRSIRLTDERGTVGVPMLGTIAAGQPIPVPDSDSSTAHTIETIQVPAEITHNRKVFALRVKGQSMVDALIDDGDIVVMEQTNTANNGDMVAVWLKDQREVTLKRIYVESGSVWLRSANSAMSPIKQSPRNVEIQGKVLGVIRKL
jgi:repressor LexA